MMGLRQFLQCRVVKNIANIWAFLLSLFAWCLYWYAYMGTFDIPTLSWVAWGMAGVAGALLYDMLHDLRDAIEEGRNDECLSIGVLYTILICCAGVISACALETLDALRLGWLLFLISLLLGRPLRALRL